MYCSHPLLWNAIAHMLPSLPPSVRVVVECDHTAHRLLAVRTPHVFPARSSLAAA